MLNTEVNRSQAKLYLLALLAMCAVILTTLAFQHIGGYQPCKLCYQQREPWYFAIPVMAIATLSAFNGWPACLTRGAALIGALTMAFSVVLAVHHSGVEWQWWEGPGDCGLVEGGIAKSTGGLLSQLETVVPPSCDAAPGRFLGLSFAGWNAVASFALGLFTLKLAFQK